MAPAYSTFVVGDAVRNGSGRFEEAVYLLTERPGAPLWRTSPRSTSSGAPMPTSCASTRRTVGPAGERTVQDLPGGASRIVAESPGMEHVIVTGTEIVHDGAYTGATPGTCCTPGATPKPSPAAPTEK